MKTVQVFVSHTSDMAAYPQGRSFVQAVLDAAGRASLASVDMRWFAARDCGPADYCRQRVRSCEVYVGVIGFRYGSVVPGEAVSYTELEFDEAGIAGVPRLMFLLADAADMPDALVDADRDAVLRFRQRILDSGLIVRSFTSEMALELEAFHALTDVTGTRERPPDPAGVWPDVQFSVPRCPYRGLRAFSADDGDAGLFVGREEEVAELRRMVEQQALVVVAGSSGVGKTSLVTAGLIPVLRREGWIARTFRPGTQPVEAMAEALCQMRGSGMPHVSGGLAQTAARLRSGGLDSIGSELALPGGETILLFADQVEEALDPGTCPADVTAEFLDLLLSLRSAAAGGIRLICALRTDFLSCLLDRPDAGVSWTGSLFTLSPMSMQRLERVIAEPARVLGVGYEDGLVPEIASDAGGGRGLPLLEFALTELWQRQRRRQITFADYVAVGRVAGALSRRAERAYESASAQFAESRIRHALLLLVRSRGGAAEAAGRVVPRARLGADWEVVQALAGAESRLVVLGHDFAIGEDTAELAHDALIREWPRLSSWVDDDAGFQHWLTAMEERAEDDLLSAARLGEADRWVQDRPGDIPGQVLGLVERSKSEWLQRVTELEDARVRAERAATLAEARRLAAAAQLALVSRGVPRQVPIALAIESLRAEPTLEGDIAVRQAIRTAPIQRLSFDHLGPVAAAAFSGDGMRVVTGSHYATAWVLDAACGAVIRHLRHSDRVAAVAVSQDGSVVATGSRDWLAHVFDVATGAEICRFRHGGPVVSVALSPDGSRIATGSFDQSVRLFDIASDAEVWCRRQDGPVVQVAFSPDGTIVATGSHDRTARVLDTATGAELCHLRHDGPVVAIAFSPDGTRVAAGSYDRAARLFDVASAAELLRMVHGGTVWAVAFSPDGQRLVTGSDDGTARLFDLATGAETHRLEHGYAVISVAFSIGGTLVATGSGTSARVFDAAAGTEVCHLDHGRAVRIVTFSPDGTQVLTGSDDGTARVFGTASGYGEHRRDHGGPVWTVAFSCDGTKVATGSSDGTARVLDASSAAELCRLSHDGPVMAVAFSRDGRRIATASADGSARVLDIESGAVILTLRHGGSVWAVAYNQDATQLVTASHDGGACIFDVTDGTLLCRLDYGGPVSAAAFSPDGKLLVTGSDDGIARVFDVASGMSSHRLDHGSGVRMIAFSPDGARVLTVGENGSARLFDPVSGDHLPLQHSNWVRAVAFSPDGAWAATAGDDGVSVFDAANGAQVSLLDHGGSVRAVAFSPDGLRIAMGAEDGSVRIFGHITGRELCRLDHNSAVESIAFSPDGTRVATGSHDCSARIWLVDCPEFISQAEQRLTRNLTRQEWRRHVGSEPYRKTRSDLP